MRRVAALLLLIASSLWAGAPEELPPCPAPDYSKTKDFGWVGRTWHWNDCRGQYVIQWNEGLRGTVYQGVWRHGQPAEGSYATPDGELYTGSFRNALKHGYGELSLPDGGRYIGQFEADGLHGEGTFLYSNGDIYAGTYRQSRRHGTGVYSFANGASYTGEFQEGRFHGHGTYLSPDGEKYVGDFADDLFHGNGTHLMRNGTKYTGEFREGKRNGVGTYISAGGDKYVGDFRDGLMHGHGSYLFASGEKYVGPFRNGMFHGEGVFTLTDGRRVTGLWEDDQFIREIDTGEADAQGQAELNRERRELAEERRRLEEERREFEAARERDDPPARDSDEDDRHGVSGSGFIITADGYIVTNFHVVEGRTEVTVRTVGGKTFPATVARLDQKHDLAVLKIRASGLAYVPIGESSTVKRGAAVLVGGFPQVMVQGMEPKITDGIVSALTGIMDDATVFQISNPIQPGNSGGPLFTLDGNVIGIVSAKLSDKVMLKEFDSIPQNVNFAVKSSYLLDLLKGMRSVRLPPPNPRRKYRATEDVVSAVEPSLVLIIAR